MPVAAAVSAQGSRPQMEDAHFLDTGFGDTGSVFGGVYDGHCGSRAARYSAERLHLYFLACLEAGVKPSGAFSAAYHQISDDLKGQGSGTTAATFLLDESFIHTANAGDSRILVIGPGSMIQLTVDHRLDDPKELKRVMLCGGKIDYPYVMKGLRGIMPTRALGDEYFRDAGIISAPSVNLHPIGERDMWLVAATDGLFDAVDNRETAMICRKHDDPARLADELLREVFRRNAMPDNTTVIVVGLHRTSLRI